MGFILPEEKETVDKNMTANQTQTLLRTLPADLHQECLPKHAVSEVCTLLQNQHRYQIHHGHMSVVLFIQNLDDVIFLLL